MENASKALLIAAGILIAILLISLLIYAGKMISEYQENKVNLANIEDTSKFNEQFAQYNRSDVQGTDLISLIHKVIDYNERMTTDSINNADTYKYIDLTINMVTKTNEDKRADLTYDGNVRLFKRTAYTQNELSAKNKNLNTSFEKSIEKEIADAKNELLR